MSLNQRFSYEPIPHPRALRGVSLIELMVSLAIGLVVVGAVFANYLNNSAGARQSAALAQVTQDASLALGILRNYVTMAGYSQPVSVNNGVMTRRLTGQVIIGCDAGFTNATDTNLDMTTLACNTDTTAPAQPLPDALAIRYETDSDTSPLSKGTPSDCIGQGIAQAGVDASNNNKPYYFAESRFEITPATANTAPFLTCIGNGGLKPGATALNNQQPLVENIADMQILYGMAKPDPTSGAPGNTVVRYVPASAMAGVVGAWDNVISVRICLVVRSAANVLDKPTPYRDCTGNLITTSNYLAATDRHIYRAFTTTVVLNNRISN